MHDRISPHFSGIKRWRLPIVKAFTVVIGIILFSFLIVFSTYFITSSVGAGWLVYERTPSDISGLFWRVHGTVIAVAFIAIVFLYEFISGERAQSFAARTVVADTRGIQIISFALLANAFIAASILFFPELSGENTQPINIISGSFLIANILLFFGTIVGILYLYGRISSILLDEGIGNAVERRAKSEIDNLRDSRTPRDIEAQVLNTRIPNYPRHPPFILGEETHLSAETLGMEGVIADIDMKRLEQIHLLADVIDVEIRYSPRLGDELENNSIIIFDENVNVFADALFVFLTKEALLTKEKSPWTNE